MKRLIAVLVLLFVVTGCRNVEREIIVPGSSPTDDAAIYLAGFMDGCMGVPPDVSCVAEAKGHSARGLYEAGLLDGYVTGESETMLSE